ncbi:hypothetical protein ASD11_17030 [Aeromicrobium sp. Root495]|uniref:TetR family transcriptional regulator n=1 Tax=Aeromicrobium sp. Root495 TaxID=1736550 RepID=UPI0006F3CF49|nr:TetR family transcriptional regulator [Aeromicrobium sp. Root495]KQY56164.1 hypothetical protein ASD11_17030 [Aeromicrobium sp. Root495]
MAHRRADVVDAALRILDAYGLPDLTMRRLATELDVRPSALYHHFSDKQTLLAAVADEVLRRGAAARPVPREAPWDVTFTAAATALRDTLLAYRDGAEVVATAHALGLGEVDPRAGLESALAGLRPDVVDAAARTALLLVLGHVQSEQLHAHADSAGARVGADLRPEGAATFAAGLDLVVAGVGAASRADAT